MRRIFKTRFRKGFTLVETILSVFILVVISTMLINGFITTMGYSYQTAVYSKSASMNYSICMSETGKWNRRSNFREDGREAYVNNNIGNLVHDKLRFEHTGFYSACNNLELCVVIDKKDSLDGIVPGSLPAMDTRFKPDDSSYVDNRTTFYYYPEEYNAKGDVIVMKDVSTPGKVVYKWVSVPYEGNESLYEEDTELGKWVLSGSYNLLAANNLVEIKTIGSYSTNTTTNTVGT